MRTGLIPNSHATIDDAATPVTHRADGRGLVTVPEVPRSLRDHLRDQAQLLDELAEAARAGNTVDVLNLADTLRISVRYTGVYDFDTTAA